MSFFALERQSRYSWDWPPAPVDGAGAVGAGVACDGVVAVPPPLEVPGSAPPSALVSSDSGSAPLGSEMSWDLLRSAIVRSNTALPSRRPLACPRRSAGTLMP